MKQSQKTLRLAESAVLLAIAAVLSMVKVLDLPYGGSVTACSSLPILLIAYRHGTVWGLVSGFVFALIQFLMGASVLSYCPTALSAAAVIVLDFVLAFTVMGLGGIFRRRYPQGTALVLGALLTGAVRYLFHVISGCTVWAGLSIPTEAALLYSLAYNATYMIPETVITALGAWYLSASLDLSGDRPRRPEKVERVGLTVSTKLAVALVAAADVVLIFSKLQNAETGDFMITGLSQVNWIAVVLCSVAAIAVVIADLAFDRPRRKE